jgi:signal transduction histidine kinase
MSRPREWSLLARVTALCVASALALVLIALAAAAVALGHQSANERLLNRGTPMVLDTQTLLTALVDQESAIRGYAVNGSEADLEPYTQGLSAERTSVGDLLTLLADRPDLSARVRTVESQAQTWRATVAEPVIAAARSGDLERAKSLITDAARQRFEALRSELARLRADVDALRGEFVAQVKEGSDQLVDLLLAAGLVIVLAGVMLVVLLRYLVLGPVAKLAEEVRIVAGGDLEHAIEPDGPPEVARLAEDVEGMRQRILADLQELTRSNRDLEQFAYVASHDLQEPLRKVASFCQLLQRRYAGQLDDRADQYIGFAVDGAQRMQRLITDLLAFSRIGRLTNGFTEVDLDAVVRDAVAQREADLDATGGTVTWSDLPVVRGEEPLLSSLLANLISNSIKFRRPDVPPRIRLSARQTDDEWEITCQDNGIGIDAEFAEKVFVIFQRLHGREAYPGTGIGLAIAKKIVEYHGGRIWLDAHPTEGATIRFTLPVDRLAATEPVSPAPAERVEETIS